MLPQGSLKTYIQKHLFAQQTEQNILCLELKPYTLAHGLAMTQFT